MNPPFALKASPELAEKLLQGMESKEIPDGIFAGLKIEVFPTELLPAGCLGVLGDPADSNNLRLIVQTTDTPSQ